MLSFLQLHSLVRWAGRLLLLGYWLAAVTHGAAGTEFLTDVWTADNGLPDSSVTAIAQTPDGYLWVGTYNGLARFDGVRWVTFDPAQVPALAHARVRRLAVAPDGTLYINTYDGSLTSYCQGRFAREWTGRDEKDPDVDWLAAGTQGPVFLLHRGGLRHGVRSGQGSLTWPEVSPPDRAVGALALADGDGTIWYRGQKLGLWRWPGSAAGFDPQPVAADLNGRPVTCLTRDDRGQLWVGTDQGIFVRQGEQFVPMTPTNEVPGSVTALAVNADGSFWALAGGRWRQGQARRWVREATGLGQTFAGPLTKLGLLPDHRGGLWIYEYQRGLFHVEAGGQARHFDADQGFPGNRINCLFEDREGNWWAGLDAGGLVRLRERRFQTLTTGPEAGAKPAKSVCEDAHGTLWAATLGNGIEAWMPEGPTRTTNLGPPFAFCAYPDPAGGLWVSAGQEDLYCLTAGQLERVEPSVHGVKSILVDHAGQVWVGTKSGLFVRAPERGEFVQNAIAGWCDVRVLAEDGTGAIWAGTEAGALIRVAHGETRVFHPAANLEHPPAIWALLPDADGSLWVGTFRGGLWRFNEGQVTRFGRAEGLPDNVICQLLADDAGNLWLGTHQGIFRVAKSELSGPLPTGRTRVAGTVYGRADGLPSLECSGGYQPAAWRGRDGRLWFTTLKGVVAVQPKQLAANRQTPTVVIEDILVDGQSRGGSGGLTNAERRLVVPPGHHQCEFEYTGISLGAPDQVTFRYRLAGADADWVEAGNRRSAQYNYLRPGKYRFQVRAANGDGQWNWTGDTVNLVVEPHFYETWWCQLLAGLLVIGGVSGVIRHRATLRLRREMERMERQHELERERTRIAKDIHDDLGASLTLIAVLGDLAKKEKTGDRIEKMSGLAREAVKSLDEIVWAVNPRNDTLEHLIDYAGQFAMDYLREAGVRCRLDLPEQAPARSLPANVRHNLFLAIKEALQNIVKHAGASEAGLRITAAATGLCVVVEDNGRGFDRPPADDQADGLRNLRQRLAEIGGECRIASQPGAGTVVTMDYPWPTDAAN